MVYITGDTHRDFRRFSECNFPEQKNMSRKDIVIVLGDFGGVWTTPEDEKEFAILNLLTTFPFTICYIDGNHENFDRYYSDEFKTVSFHGGKAQKIRENVYHLLRGYVYKFDGKKFFCMGGASSHDVRDGILDPDDFASYSDFLATCRQMQSDGKQFRINHLSWWEQELPSDEEMAFAQRSLEKYHYKVDYVLTHCLPLSMTVTFSRNFNTPDTLNCWLDSLLCHEPNPLRFKGWYCGHYHVNDDFEKFHIRYNKIERLI